ncbi:MAG: hypothetical protein WCF52_08235, partial [Pseudolabrys sp.]
MANVFADWTSRAVIEARIAEERRNPVESWNELAALEDYDLSLDKIEYQIRPGKWPWLVYII